MTENRNKQTKKEEETEYNLIKIQVPLKVSCEKGKKFQFNSSVCVLDVIMIVVPK